jgi:hypothetical protein
MHETTTFPELAAELKAVTYRIIAEHFNETLRQVISIMRVCMYAYVRTYSCILYAYDALYDVVRSSDFW